MTEIWSKYYRFIAELPITALAVFVLIVIIAMFIVAYLWNKDKERIKILRYLLYKK